MFEKKCCLNEFSNLNHIAQSIVVSCAVGCVSYLFLLYKRSQNFLCGIMTIKFYQISHSTVKLRQQSDDYALQHNILHVKTYSEGHFLACSKFVWIKMFDKKYTI